MDNFFKLDMRILQSPYGRAVLANRISEFTEGSKYFRQGPTQQGSRTTRHPKATHMLRHPET